MSTCDHSIVEHGDGHGNNYWECVRCHETWWVAPWLLRTRQNRGEQE